MVFLVGPGDCADEPCDAFVVEETERGFQCRVEVPAPYTSEPMCLGLFDLPPAGEEVEHRIFSF